MRSNRRAPWREIRRWLTRPLSLHATTADPWFDLAVVDEVARAIPTDLLDLHRYDSCGHLVSDHAWIDHDPHIADRILHHVLHWLRDRHQGS